MSEMKKLRGLIAQANAEENHDIYFGYIAKDAAKKKADRAREKANRKKNRKKK